MTDKKINNDHLRQVEARLLYPGQGKTPGRVCVFLAEDAAKAIEAAGRSASSFTVDRIEVGGVAFCAIRANGAVTLEFERAGLRWGDLGGVELVE